ncbi:polysaccharide biosynthesis/export family protein [Sphingosinicella terrae]|uniref:polysaccharide biosynthesis/export family protein n=1 Tax=Sphingosinicella terrae TaxID=2172047 RepID=UPI0013B3BE5B|nr:polysaccharide biosynthesis/export family protein [Sphingosinicella terrae]
MLTACGYRRAELPPPTAEFNQPPDPLFADPYDHRLGPTDLVGVAVYRAPEFTGDYRVDSAGNISLPLVGAVPVQGMTIEEASVILRERIGQTYYVNPDVSVVLKESTSQRLVVDGSVRSPGVYPVPGRVTLMEAVARAGGTTGAANLRRVVIFRQIEGQRHVAVFDLRQIQEAQTEDPLVYASDIIIVDGSQTRQVLRDVISTLPIVALFRPFIY